MYSGSKGKHGSKRPLNPSFSWVKYTQKEIEQLIIKLAKSEKTPAQIGLILRDSYGIPDIRKLAGKKVKKILDENKLKAKIPEELIALIKSGINLGKHLEKNTHQKTTAPSFYGTSPTPSSTHTSPKNKHTTKRKKKKKTS